MTNTQPRLLIFASGTKTGGGSGFENLVNATKTGILNANIVAVVSNHKDGGVREKADRLGIPFILFSKNSAEEEYQKILDETRPDYVALSGWLKLVKDLNPKTTFNIHPAPLPRFGGKGLYGHHVHEKVLEAYKKGEVSHSAVSMHFVTPKYDEGPIFFSMPVEIKPNDTPETLGKRVNEEEHKWQPIITNKVIHGKIGWDGKNKDSLFGAEIY